MWELGNEYNYHPEWFEGDFRLHAVIGEESKHAFEFVLERGFGQGVLSQRCQSEFLSLDQRDDQPGECFGLREPEGLRTETENPIMNSSQIHGGFLARATELVGTTSLQANRLLSATQNKTGDDSGLTCRMIK